MSWIDTVRCLWQVIRARGELSFGPAALDRQRARESVVPLDVVRDAVPDRSLGLCDACGLAWGVEMWLHPDELLITVLCRHHSRQQALALRERRWSRLVRPPAPYESRPYAGWTRGPV